MKLVIVAFCEHYQAINHVKEMKKFLNKLV